MSGAIKYVYLGKNVCDGMGWGAGCVGGLDGDFWEG